MQLHIPRSFTAPDAIFPVLVVLFLQYKQRSRLVRQSTQNQKKGGTKKPLHASSLFHELLFTNLSMMVSPSTMASTLNANVVDLKEEVGSKKDSKKSKVSSKSTSSGLMEIRSRRIREGELVLSKHFPMIETPMNCALSVLLGLILRWVFGLVRSLRLSRMDDGVGGVCCSSYQGIEGDSKSSFERLLACVLIKSEGDEAGKLPLSALLLCLFGAIFKLAGHVASANEPSRDSHATKDEKGRHVYRRVSKQKVKRFFALIGATLSALWLFHTPALLRYFGLFGLIEAFNELSARILLLGNLIGIVTIPENDPLFGHTDLVQNLTNLLLTAFAIFWGIYASILVECIQETARNGAFIMSSNPSKNKNKKHTPDEMVKLMNTRIMLVIQTVAPLVIVCTFFAESHFAETLTKAARGGGNASFSKQYLQNSGQFVRAGLSWSFLGASIYTIRAMLQSYLDQASTVASAMSIYGGSAESPGKQAAKSNQTDPFSDRYAKVVPTAGKILAFPAFVFAILAFAHIRGGDVTVHPGVNQESIDALSVSAIKGLSPAYSGEYSTWIMNSNELHQKGSHSLMQAASMSQSTWEETPFRDGAHRKVAHLLGEHKFCNTPTPRAVRSMGRELHYMMLQSKNTPITENTTLPIAINGPQLLELAHDVPYSLINLLVGPNNAESHEMTCGNQDHNSEQEDTVCAASPKQYPSVSMVFSSIMSHSILTPTIVVPVVETLSLLSSIWWTIWYTVVLVLYWIKINKAAGLHISA